jgi:CDP-glucose 4,6-dehydratase
VETWSTNVIGTALLLESCRAVPGVKAVVAVTTDKVYANQERPRGYRESDPRGGHDPYSASKAAAEILVESYRKSFFGDRGAPLLASARGGNVVGGGDWADDRLIPDAVRAVQAGQPLMVRFPRATRPWQHVLDCLAGYLLLGQRLLEGRREYAAAWNFGPRPRDSRTVAEILALLKQHWPALTWKRARRPGIHEATLLHLDASRARDRLRWQPVWAAERALEETVKWYRSHLERGTVISREQLASYVRDARVARASWARP